MTTRVLADGELLDISTSNFFHAVKVARLVRPDAIVVTDTAGGRHELKDDDDTELYAWDSVAHWSRPGETGEIVRVSAFRHGRTPFVMWPGSETEHPYMAADLIRVTAAK